MSKAGCGPLAALGTLTAAKQDAEQLAQACCDALGHLDAALHAHERGHGNGAQGSDWVQALVRAVNGRLSDKGLTGPLLQQYGQVLARCLQHQQLCSGAQPSSCVAAYVACYRCTRLLLTHKAAAAAYTLAWRLHEHAAAAAAAGWDLPPAMQEAAIGSGLTILICSCEQLGVEGGVLLQQLLEACQAVLDLIRQQSPDKAQQHADALFRYLLKVLGGVQDAAADAGATAGLMGCLMQAVLASPQADKLSQVMLKAVSQLPPQLSWCGLAGVVLWVGSETSLREATTANSSSSGNSSIGCVWQCADALLDWAVRHRRCGTWASSLSSWAGGLEPSSSSSGAATVLMAGLPVLLRAVGPEGVSKEDAERLQQCAGRLGLAPGATTGHDAPPTGEQHRSSKGRNGSPPKAARKQAADDSAQAVGGASNSEGALLLCCWCLCKLGGVLQQQQQQQQPRSSKAPATERPGPVAAVVLQLLLEALSAASKPGGSPDLQVHCELVQAAGLAFAAAATSHGSSSSSSRKGSQQLQQPQCQEQCQMLVEAVTSLCDAAGAGASGTAGLKALDQAGRQLQAAGSSLHRAGEAVPASCLLWCSWRLQACALQRALSSSEEQQVPQCSSTSCEALQEVVAAAKAVLSASGSSSSSSSSRSDLDDRTSSSWWLQQEQQLQDVLVETLLLVARAQLPALQHQDHMLALCKGWARYMRGESAAGAAGHTVLRWLQQQQQQQQQQPGSAEAQQGPLLLLSKQVDGFIAVDMCCLNQHAAGGKLPAGKVATAVSDVLELAAEVCPTGWQQPHWAAQVQLLRAVHSMQDGSTAADVALELAAACDMLAAISSSQDRVLSRSDRAAGGATGGGRAGGAGSSKRRSKKQASLQQQQHEVEAQPEEMENLIGLHSSSGLAYCLQGMHLHHQQQQELSAAGRAAQDGSSSSSTAIDEPDSGTQQPAAAIADCCKMQQVLRQAASCWLRCCHELQALASAKQGKEQACSAAWRLPMQCAAAAAEAVYIAGSRGWLQLEQQLCQVTFHLAALQEVQQPTGSSGGTGSSSSGSSSSSGDTYWLGQVLSGIGTQGCGATPQPQDLADVMGGMTLDDQSSSSTSHNSSSSSRRPEELLSAAYAAFYTGDTVQAVHCAEAAARKCGYRLEPSAKGPTAASDSSASASARWGQLRSYCTCCWLLGQLMEVLGLPDDALCWFKELQQVAAGLSSAPLCAVAASAVAWLQGRRGDAARATSALQDAQRHWEQWQLELAGTEAAAALQTPAAAAEGCVEQQHDPSQQLLHAVVYSWLLAAQAEQALLLQELPAAAAHLQSALGQLTGYPESAGEGQEHKCTTTVLMAVQQQAAVRSRLAHCKRLQGDMAAAGSIVQEGLQQLEDAAQQLGRRMDQHFAIQQAALKLQLCQLQAYTSNHRVTSNSRGNGSSQAVLPLQLAGFNCSSSHDLSREFVGAEPEEQQAAAGSRKAASRGKGARGTQEEEVPAVSSLQLLQQLLQLLPATRGAPLLLQRACQLAAEVCRQEGALPAAAMFLQLSLGTSAQQHHLLHTQRMARKACKASGASSRASTAAASTSTPVQAWQQAGELLGVQDLLRKVASCCCANSSGGEASAASTKRSKGGRARSGCLSSSSGTPAPVQGTPDQQEPAALLQQLDTVAGAWLESLLEQLPAGCDLTSISCHGEAPEAQALLVCRCSKGDAPLLVVLQHVEAAGVGPPAARSVTELTQRLADTLSASSTSMSRTADLTSAAGKAAWWQQRVALDTNMKQLLQDLGSDWLGPWRCLLLPRPPGQEAASAAASAAGELVEEQFGAVLEGTSLERLTQLVAHLLPHMGNMAPEEVATAALHLCQLTHTRADGGQVQQLADALAKAHAGLPASVTAGGGSGRSGGSKAGPGDKPGGQQQPAMARRPLGEINAGLTSGANSRSSRGEPSAGACRQEGGDGVCAPPATPAAPKASSRLGGPPTVQRSTAGRSRLGSMQQSTPARRPPTEAAAAASDAGAADLSAAFAQRLQLDDAGQSAVPQEPPTPAAAGGATGRRVRFCEEAAAGAAEAAGSGSECLVPPSVVRHGMRRNQVAAPDGDAGAAAPASALGGAAAEGFTTPAVKPKRGSRLAGMSTGKPQATSSRIPLQERLQQAAGDEAPVPQVPPITPARNAAWQSRQAVQPGPADQATAVTSRSTRVADARSTASCSSRSGSSTAGASYGLLVLDAQLQALPWEALSGLQQHDLYRCPNLAVAAALAYRSRNLPAAADMDSSGADAGDGAGAPATTGAVLRAGTSYYVLNPDGDLPDTQATFEPWLQDALRLQGVSGCRPAATDLAGALEQHDLFLYFGHGSGEQYLPLSGLRRLARCAGGVLLGCSSGRLRSNGMYEPSGPVLGYLMAGCPAAVANLWDVTDRDIDRFGEMLLQHWLGNNPTTAGAPSSSRSSGNSHKRADKGAAAATGRDYTDHQGWVAGVVNDSRDACRLQWLIGAAPVCYGVPTRVLPVTQQQL